ncbi:hypothetical protein [Paraburkholderia tropica]|uniref:hypothetical protein n=1 Tax=Paraburkholderia tropica TaxID=92647 RepID=UPI0018167CDC|nr:hypothetical protein [Paraburkholderia tropica]MBB6319256.1 hypothetical protein [Paraburkholderia tropica]
MQKAIASGRIAVDADGKIDSEIASAQWDRNADESKRAFADISRPSIPFLPAIGASPTAVHADADSADDDDASLAGAKDEDPSLAAYRASRASREALRYEKELLELEEMRGNLIPLAEAQRLGFTALRTVRDAVLNVPVRIKDIVAAETDAMHIERLLSAELTSALNAIDIAAAMRDEDGELDDGS